MLEPLVAREELARRVGDREIWEALFERPIGETIESVFDDDLLRGIVLTDALIGTFAGAHDAEPAPEPLLPLPRDRQRHRRVGRARSAAWAR